MESRSNDVSNDVAIIGMSCLFPGAPDVRAFWRNIVSKVSSISEPPRGWSGPGAFVDPDSPAADPIHCQRGGFLGDLARFDPLRYGIMPHTVDGGDPEHFLALRVAHEALADAGYLERPFDRSRTGIILGRSSFLHRGNVNALQHELIVDQTLRILGELHPEYTRQDLLNLKKELAQSLPPFNAETAPGLVSNVLCGLVANRLDLRGPHYTVDAACASSLIAVDLGMRELSSRRCDLILAGGVSASVPNVTAMVFRRLGAISLKGEVRPFHKDADGTLLGEGLGMVALKRRADAERDRDRIYAVVKSVGIAGNGRGHAVLAPDLEGEETALRRAYGSAGISPSTVELLEAHGTGTPVGDLTEAMALARVFGTTDADIHAQTDADAHTHADADTDAATDGKADAAHRCAVGSVKSMIGHTLPAAGIAGLIKAAMALHHRVLPPTLHCAEPNPAFELEKTALYLNTEPRPWVHGGPHPRRAGVNAFGFGGINAHAILEEYPDRADQEREDHKREGAWLRWETELCLIRGDTRRELMEQAEALMGFLSRSSDVELKDLAFTLNCPARRTHHTLAIVAGSPADLGEKLAYALHRLGDPGCGRIKDRKGIFFFEEPLTGEGGLAFLLPGEGSQYVTMLSELCMHFPYVRGWLDRADRVFREAGRAVLPSRVLYPEPLAPPSVKLQAEEALRRMDLAVASIFAADCAYVSLLNRLGIHPRTMAGHSSGELAALAASGILNAPTDVEGGGPFENCGAASESVYRLAFDLCNLSLEESAPAGTLMTVARADQATMAAVIAESRGAVSLAMDNCPHQVILCGAEPAIRSAREKLERQGAYCGFLPFHRAYHTDSFRPVCDRMAPLYRDLPVAAPRTELYSCSTARPYPREPDRVRELALEQWARPVLFRRTIEAMYEAGVRIFVEAGPRGMLTGFVDDILRGRRYLAAACNSEHRSDISQLNTLLGLLAAHGVPMDLKHLYERRAPKVLSLELAGGKRCASVPRGPVESDGSDPGSGSPGPLDHPRGEHSRGESGKAAERSVKLALELPLLRLGDVPAGKIPSPHPPLRGHAAEVGFPLPRGEGQGEGRSALEAPLTPTLSPEAGEREKTACLDSATSSPRGRGDLEPEADASSEESDRASRSAVDPFHLSFSRVVEGKELSAVCLLDPEEWLFLRDHTMGREPSVLDEARKGLGVLPLAMSVELMARAGSRLCPDLPLVAMKKVRIHKWITVEGGFAEKPGVEAMAGPRAVLLRAARVDSPVDGEVTVQVMMFEAAGNSLDDLAAGALLSEGVAVHATGCSGADRADRAERAERADPTDPAPSPLPLKDERPFRFLRERYYREVMFHGPAFQSVSSIDRCGEDGVEARVEIPQGVRLFRSVENPHFLAHPILLDAAGQTVGFWAADRLNEGFVVFPVGFEALHFFGAPRGSASRSVDLRGLRYRTRIRKAAEKHIQSDMELVNDKGELVLRLQGWEDQRFYFDRSFVRFILSPVESMLSVPWLPASGWPGDPAADGLSQFCGCRLKVSRVTAFGMRDILWTEVVARIVLTPRELVTWRRLADSRGVRQSWLLGRMACKDAVRQLLKERCQWLLGPADVEIGVDGHGREALVGLLADMIEEPILVSASEKDGTAVAVAAPASACTGRDGGLLHALTLI